MDKTAYWIKEEITDTEEVFTCSSCNDKWDIDMDESNTDGLCIDVERCFKYCPHCGAKILGVKMKEGE